MSLFPYVLRDMLRPLRMMEHQMKLAEEMFPTYFPAIRNRASRMPYLDISEDGTESVIQDKEKFQIKFDVKNFAPQEITVKTVGVNSILIEGKHEEKEDDKGFISRQFIRKFELPKGHDLKAIVSSLSANGILTITAPRKVEAQEAERVIPITHEEAPKNQQKSD